MLVVRLVWRIRLSYGLSGELVKGLSDEVGASQSAVDEAGFATFLGDRRDAGVGLQVRSRLPAGAVGLPDGGYIQDESSNRFEVFDFNPLEMPQAAKAGNISLTMYYSFPYQSVQSR